MRWARSVPPRYGTGPLFLVGALGPALALQNTRNIFLPGGLKRVHREIPPSGTV
jgi:hypothetical protein